MAEMLCGVCNSEPKKYKCPTCALPYCSITCFKEHKATHPDAASTTSTPAPALEIPQPPPPEPIPKYLRKKIDFSILATNPKFQDLLRTQPTLLPSLQRIYAATIEPDPDDDPPPRRGGYRGRGRADRGRGRGRRGRWRGGDYETSRWSQKKGDADALGMLKWFREGMGSDEEKEAVAAFVSLVEEMFGDGDKKQEQEAAGLKTGEVRKIQAKS